MLLRMARCALACCVEMRVGGRRSLLLRACSLYVELAALRLRRDCRRAFAAMASFASVAGVPAGWPAATTNYNCNSS